MKLTKKRICVVSSSRADYSHLYLLMKKLKEHPKVDFKLVVTGMHTISKYGNTKKQFLDDGFKISDSIDNNQKNTSASDILLSIGTQLSKTHNVLKKINPDVIIILGDRYDIFPIAIAAHIMQIPLAHIAGGELTYGAIDDGIRHCISKLANFHFVANKKFKSRLINMGEKPSSVFNVGSLGVQSLKNIKKIDVREKYKIKSGSKYFLICLHPQTIDYDNQKAILNIIKAVDKYKDYHLIFSRPNSDTSSDIIHNRIMKYANKNIRVSVINSAGREDFINLLRYSSCIIGNSSSGIIEAPYLQIPTVNIGLRQKGRPLSSTVIQCSDSISEIDKSIRKSQSKIFLKKKLILAYEGRNSTNKIINVLLKANKSKILMKEFYDII